MQNNEAEVIVSPLSSINLIPPNGTRWVQWGSELRLEYSRERRLEIVDWLHSVATELENGRGENSIVPLVNPSLMPIVNSSVPPESGPVSTSINPPVSIRSLPTVQPLDEKISNLMIAEQKITAPSLETFNFMRKVVIQAARLWPNCKVSAMGFIESVQNTFYTNKTEPKEIFEGRQLPPNND